MKNLILKTFSFKLKETIQELELKITIHEGTEAELFKMWPKINLTFNNKSY